MCQVGDIMIIIICAKLYCLSGVRFDLGLNYMYVRMYTFYYLEECGAKNNLKLRALQCLCVLCIIT